MAQTDRLIRKRIGQVVVQTIASSIVLFAIANDLRWTMAWVYLGIGILITSFNFFVLIRINPEVVAERARQSKDLRRWDKFLLALYGSGIASCRRIGQAFWMVGAAIAYRTRCECGVTVIKQRFRHVGDGGKRLFFQDCAHPGGTRA